MEKVRMTYRFFKIFLDQVTEKSRLLLKQKGKSFRSTKAQGLYGFGKYENSSSTIKGAVLSDPGLKERMKEYYREEYKHDRNGKSKRYKEPGFLEEDVKGKYLYLRSREADKRKAIIELSPLYATLYLGFLECHGTEEFIEKYKDKLKIPESVVDSQREVTAAKDGDFIPSTSTSFIGYYFSFRDNAIKKMGIQIDYVSMKVRQLGFHYSVDSMQPGESNFIDLSNSTEYIGKAEIVGAQKNFLALTMKGDEGNKSTSYMSLMLYTGAMDIKNMDYVRGALHTISAHGYIFSGEVFFKRDNETLLEKMLELSYDEKHPDVTQMKRYLFLQRRTNRISPTTPKTIKEVTVKRYSIEGMKVMVGTWKLWIKESSTAILQAKLVVGEDYSAKLYTVNMADDQYDVCNFKMGGGAGAQSNLWMTITEKYPRTEQRGSCLFKLPPASEESTLIINGKFCGQSPLTDDIIDSEVVLIRCTGDEPVFATSLDQKALADAVFSPDLNLKYKRAYQIVMPNKKKTGDSKKSLLPFPELMKSHKTATGNASTE